MRQGLARAVVGAVALILVWGMLAALALLEVWPWRPTSTLGWLGFAAAGPVVYMVLEGLGELTMGKLFSTEPGSRSLLSRLTPLGALVAAAVVALLVAAAVAIAVVVGRAH